MKKSLILALALGCFSSLANATSLSSKLANSPTDHLQLLANNLNMFMLLNLEKLREQSVIENKEFLEVYFRASVENNGTLKLHAMYEAPVSSISKAKCQAKLKKYVNELKENGGITTFQAVSYYYLSRQEALSLLNESTYSITIVAKENNELQISCS
ncbi:hypothetical protein [Pseudoalteromonas sp. T1lg22]|uniref:hypothetical protein n=1 Tax=Pseudoalteromonas sp. T1lg22 TaxID=2077096 RepID=UPI000CF6A7C3|nr:hypothetical protein [Pseudoalteromonas sp. T1lg22]